LTNNDKFESIKNNISNNYNRLLGQLKSIEQQLTQNNDQRKIDFYNKRVNSIMESISNYKNILSCMRPNNEKDIETRQKILNTFPLEVKEIIPDSVPLVFHGNKNIETVKQIIKSGGLFTPNQRGTDYKSFATQIDVTYKNDIHVSCEFAESGINSFMPYGAIFVFLPKKEEYDKVLKTGDSSEVYGGVEEINFIEEPERLFSIITTIENLSTLKNICEEKGIDSSKVLTHEQFLTFCKSKFKNYDNEENNTIKGR
jgi:hypothetical protein